MRELFRMDREDYNPEGKVYERPSARAVILKEPEWAALDMESRESSLQMVSRMISSIQRVFSQWQDQ